MKALVCEMCNSTDLVKQDGVFVCQHCGTKYSVEEAKKLMVEGKVDVSGSTVKIDNTNKLANMYTLARRAVQGGNWTAAHSYYNTILLEEPNSWEAVLFTPYTRRDGQKTDLLEYGIHMMNSIPEALELIKQNIPEAQQLSAVKYVASCSNSYSMWIAKNVEDYLRYCFSNNITGDVSRWLETYYVAAEINYSVGQFVLFYFSSVEDEYEKLITEAIESAIKLLEEYVCGSGFLIGVSKNKAHEKIQKYRQKIKSYNTFYQMPETSSGCYVATAVYGSYDCPQVWTLRRFRDNTLARTWYGRAFIHMYYAISPILVKWFGNTAWFKNFWRGKLDKMVDILQNHGVEASPYQDIIW